MKKPRLAAESQNGGGVREARLSWAAGGGINKPPPFWVGLVIQRIEHEGIDILKHHGIHRLGIEADLVDRDCTENP